MGWRIGTAYEIPEIAFRASLVYSTVHVNLGDITGTAGFEHRFLDNRRSIPVVGNQSMPQSVELKLQSRYRSGLARLRFGQVGRLERAADCPISAQFEVRHCVYGNVAGRFRTSLDPLYQDGWTVSGGIGHKFNEQWSGRGGPHLGSGNLRPA